MTTERKRAYMKEWRQKNIGRLRVYGSAYHRKWRKEHREEQRDYWRKWRYDNRTGLLTYQKQWRMSRPLIYRRHALKKKYGITVDEYNAILKSQNGVCAICRKPSDKTLHIDHDHETGEIRGILCHNCNLTLGRMKEDPERLRTAAEYLEFFAFKKVWGAA